MSKIRKHGEPSEQSAAASGSKASAGPKDAQSQLSNGAVQDIAQEGASGAGSDLPYLDQIQESFGDYDLSGIKAHTDKSAADGIGANAYASGSDVVFGEGPSLGTAAEEATHVIQQAAGRGPSGGVGKEGDPLEKHADEVVAKVEKGESAVASLDKITGGDRSVSPGKSQGVQREAKKEAPPPQKEVSPKAMGRLFGAQMGINHTKELLSFGAGNQVEALKSTNFNANFRMQAVRGEEDIWKLADPDLLALVNQYPEAFTAAKVEKAQGGNCGEHAATAFDYLRQNMGNDLVQSVSVSGLDHAFVMIGDFKAEKANELVICDPWPTAPTACLWEDHFAHTEDTSQIKVARAAINDTRDVRSEIAAGLELTAKGKQLIATEWSAEATQKYLDEYDAKRDAASAAEQERLQRQERTGTEEAPSDAEKDFKAWMWQHPDAVGTIENARGDEVKQEYSYVPQGGQKVDKSGYTGTMLEDIKAWMSRGQT